MSEPVRVRFAPSPTGYLHVGGARTALFNWLFARRHGGTFVLRLEDTDEVRNTPEALQRIFEGLRWLGLDPDEGPEQGGPYGPYRQSERAGIHARAVRELQEGGAAYPCFATKVELEEMRERQLRTGSSLGYDGRYRDLDPDEARHRIRRGEPHTWRLRVPEGRTEVHDLVRGPVAVDHADVEDFILVRADASPVYNLAVVIDDHHMRITHVLRGEDHLTNTFKQLLLFKALGWDPPRYGHLPLILGPTGQGKLSKRRHPEAALEHYQARDYPAEAVVNWLALVGWSYDDHTEIMSREELIQRFSLDRVHHGGARLPLEKLEALSGHYIRQAPQEEVRRRIQSHLRAAGMLPEEPDEEQRRLGLLVEMLQDRLRHYSEAVEMARWVVEGCKEYEPKAARNLLKEGVPDLLRAYAASLPEPLPEPGELESSARTFAASRGVGFGRLVHPVRAALTGRSSGPPLFHCLALLGTAESRRRLERAASWAEEQAASGA